MKLTKKITAVCLAFLLAFSPLAGIATESFAAGTATVQAVHRGDEVVVVFSAVQPVTVRGFGLNFRSAYDPAVFEWVSGEWSGTVQSKADLISVNAEKEAVFAAEEEFVLSGEVFILVLKVKVDAPLASYNVALEVRKGGDLLLNTATIIVHECKAADDVLTEGEYHWNPCRTEGCEERLNLAKHEFTLQDKDDASHFMKCAVCGTIDETTRTAHGYDNACDTTCDACGYTRTITHNYSVQDKDDASHFMKCAVCGTPDETTRTAHGYDNACDTTCDACGYTRTITHNYTVQDKDDASHFMKCAVCGTPDETTRTAHGYDNACDTTCDACGYIRTITHDYSVQDKDKDNHFMKCAVCGTPDETTRKAHDYENSCDGLCETCGQTRTVAHDMSVQDKDETGHFMKCSVCGKADENSREAHGYDNACDTTCDACGYTRTITHDYSVQDKDKDNHFMKCAVCGTPDETTRKAHDYENSCDGLCETCGQTRTVAHDMSVQDKDETGHFMKCSICGKADENSREAHDFDNACDTTCDTCGYTRTITHNYTVQDKDDASHFMKCAVCGTPDETTRTAHSYDNACDSTCDACGYTRTVTHDYSVQDHDRQTHFMKCSICGEADENSRKAHEYDDQNDLTCGGCGYERTPYLEGDTDGNDVVDSDDAIYLLYYVNFPSAYPVYQPVDFDGSGVVDSDDAIYLLYHVNFPASYPLFPVK